ncbi:rhomboid family intramembrane serine protease [Paraburkholderia acidisoli]|uniref:Rhomboid family intramembrane serine protease n=1 Tax=Paraburkholderia acidisoli TaxID=2571748 RepID=A0A7Z2GPK1_9BURK|nr:rhomboid family intramembrane serine protease [Paraburkholderia acidisoli]QGZ65607.1 rhomboid family intramembrane serine protease [Paraburkholderia acidisoli]
MFQPRRPAAQAPTFRTDPATAIDRRLALLGIYVGSIWAVFIVSAVFPGLELERYGVRPRSLAGLEGILFAPWLHANLAHILANSGALIVLGWLTMWPRISVFWAATAGSMLGAGLCAWLLGAPDSVHIGASGVVFGYGAFLVARGWYTRHLLSVLVALGVAATYGTSMLMGVLPVDPAISWQSHLGGAIGGLIAARLVSARVRNAREVQGTRPRQ